MLRRIHIHFFMGLLGLLLFQNHPLSAQQSAADSSVVPSVEDPAYRKGTGPVICVDAAQYNFHTLGGGYAPFGRLLQRAVEVGYRPQNRTA